MIMALRIDLLFINCELRLIPEKDCEIVLRFILHRSQFRMFLLLKLFPPKTTKTNLLCYLTLMVGEKCDAYLSLEHLFERECNSLA